MKIKSRVWFWLGAALAGVGAAQVLVTTTEPEWALEWLQQAARSLGADARYWVGETQSLAMAVRRLLAEVKG